MIGQIPPEISALQKLEVLAFNGNCIYGGLPSTLGLMINLQQLNLNDNGLSGYVPDELFNMISLTHLKLAGQMMNDRSCVNSGGDVIRLNNIMSSSEVNYGLEGPFFENITSLLHLQEVDISDNYFSGQISQDIKKLKQLGE